MKPRKSLMLTHCNGTTIFYGVPLQFQQILLKINGNTLWVLGIFSNVFISFLNNNYVRQQLQATFQELMEIENQGSFRTDVEILLIQISFSLKHIIIKIITIQMMMVIITLVQKEKLILENQLQYTTIPQREVNSGGYIPRHEALRCISTALHRP